MAERALVPGDTGQAQCGSGPHRAGDRDRLGHVPHAGTAARRAQLDAHVHRPIGARLAQGGVHDGDGTGGVHPAGEREAGVPVELGADPRQPRGVEQAAGEHQAAHPEGPGDAELWQVRERETPGPGGELALPEGGRHRALAVRGQGDPRGRDPGGHRLDVVVQGPAFQGEQRRPEVRERGPPGEVLPGRDPGGVQGRGLEPPVEPLLAQCGDSGGVDGHRASSFAWIALVSTRVITAGQRDREAWKPIFGAAMSDKTAVRTDGAPAPAWVFSQGVRKGPLLQVSGQGPQDPGTSEYVHPGDVRAQTRRTLENVKAILTAGGATVEDVMMFRVYLTKREDFAPMNEAYGDFVRENCPSGVLPCRTTVFTGLPNEAMLVEIDALAYVG